jgi:hypothetical protein
LLLLLLFISCGNNTSSTSVESEVINGKVADGYLINAKVCLDKNENYLCDSDEPMAYTNENGEYFLKIEKGDENRYPVLVEVTKNTVDTDTGNYVEDEYLLFSPPGEYKFISPYTTLVKTVMDLNPQFGIEDAKNYIETKLGLSDVDILVNYMEENTSKNEMLHKIAKNLTKLFIQNYQIAKKNLSSTTKMYVLGFSYALTHTAYDNVDIKGAAKKTFQPDFNGIITLPDNKDIVENLYSDVINKLSALKDSKIESVTTDINKSFYAIDYYENNNSVDFYVAKAYLTPKSFIAYEVKDSNLSILNFDVDYIINNFQSDYLEWNVTYENGVYAFKYNLDDSNLLMPIEKQIVNYVSVDLNGKVLSLKDCTQEDYLSDKSILTKVQFGEGDKEYLLTFKVKPITFNEAMNYLIDLINQNKAYLAFKNISLNEVLTQGDYLNIYKNTFFDENCSLEDKKILCNNMVVAEYNTSSYNGMDYLFIKNYWFGKQKEVNVILLDMNNNLYELWYFNMPQVKTFNSFNKSATNKILKVLQKFLQN